MPQVPTAVARRCARELWHALLDLVLPPRCAACAEPVALGPLCDGCAHRLEVRRPPLCARCGEPLAGAGARCRAGHRDLTLIDAARAPLRYRGTGALLVHRLKFQRDLVAGRLLARHLGRAVPSLVQGANRRALVVPVPRHRSKVRRDRFDPADWLAREVAVAAGLPVAPAALRRTRATLPQADPRVTSREANVAGAFECRHAFAVRGRPVLLVDDVFTSGATARACTRALLEAGARSVAVLTAARA